MPETVAPLPPHLDAVRTRFEAAWQRAGAGPIGVFSVMIGPDSPALYVLLVHKSLDAFASLPERVAADAEYEKAAAPYTNAEATAPAFVRIETSLMRSFESIPKLELPFSGGENARRSRIFELRTYENPTEKAQRAKMRMFSEMGEIEIFKRVGLTPVFFSRTLIGPHMPSIVYMLVHENMAGREKSWSNFSADPEWQKVRATPGYSDADIVSNITTVFLRPAGYSQI